MPRPDGRAPDQLRPSRSRATSCCTRRARCSSSSAPRRSSARRRVEDKVPPFLKGQGARLGHRRVRRCCPRSTNTRMTRENRGPSGRSQEIQRLVGRALRAVIDRGKLGERTVWIDCDVIQADGGTRTAAITGGFVALADALARIPGAQAHAPCSATASPPSAWASCSGQPLLDLNYVEDSTRRGRHERRHDGRRRVRRGAGHRRAGRRSAARRLDDAAGARRARHPPARRAPAPRPRARADGERTVHAC